MNLGLRTLLIVMAAVTCIASQGRAQEIQVSHESAGRILQIEHAEVLIPPSNTSLPTMYLTIWNGTAFSENLVGVESDSFTGVTVFSNTFGRREQRNDVLTIPSHAELKMMDPGVHMVLQELEADPLRQGSVPIILRFDGDRSVTINARIVQDREDLISHHHGEPDNISD